MTFDPSNAEGGVPQDFEGPIRAMPVEEPRRAGSLTLRSDDVREARAASMEAANKSLADALRVTYRLLQLVMVVLVGLFFLSGFQQVNQSESGLRVELGKLKSERLDPGFQFSWPYPLGEIVKVQTGSQTLELDDAFWPELSPEDRRKSLDEVAKRSDRLEPGRDGALMTGDSNMAHLQLSIVYTRSDPAKFVKNVYPNHEQALVRGAVKRAAVAVAATAMIDDLLKPGAASGDRRENSIESRIRVAAQQTLDAVESGLEVNQVLIRSASPPQVLRKDFNQVQIALSNAGKARDQALGDRSRTLNEAAGSAHQPLLDLIDSYEKSLELGDAPASASIMQEIEAVLSGERNGALVKIGGREYPEVTLSGEVAQMISEAQQYRTAVVQQSQRKVETFEVLRGQYEINRSVFLTRRLTQAISDFIRDPLVEIVWKPDLAEPFELLLTPDPKYQREAEQLEKERDVENNPRVRQLRSFEDR